MSLDGIREDEEQGTATETADVSAGGPLDPEDTVEEAVATDVEGEIDEEEFLEAARDEDADGSDDAPEVEAASEVLPAEEGETGDGSDPHGQRTPEELLESAVEAVLFSSEVPLPAQRLSELVSAEKRDVLAAIDRLNVFYGDTHRSFRVAPLAGGFQLVTTPENAPVLTKLHKEKVPTRLSRAALETLAIIAFKQPVTRAEVDSIRGVSASDRVLRHLMDRKLVRLAGRAEAPGRPLLYATTREFLGYFGLSSVKDLPRTDELAALLAGESPSEAIDDEIQDALTAQGMEPIETEPTAEETVTESAATEAHADEEVESPGDLDPAEDATDPEVGVDDGHDPDTDDEFEGMMEGGEEPFAGERFESHSGEESDEGEGDPAPQ
ncbi:MAG: SMC-Scp complex subunit ScpB [Gemmatimonadetes bacterium]|nr:SMC-Scp complex subunit ScpB [Gemmatimonadota bacterium]